MILRVWNMGWDAVNWAWGYFVLGAIVVVPLWLAVRVLKAQNPKT
jgi:hypothetical protein